MNAIRRAVFAALLGLSSATAAEQPERVELVIRNALVVPMTAPDAVIEEGVVAIAGARIAAVGGAELLDRYEAETVIDAGGDIVMPGMVNLHTHIPMVAFRGLGEYDVADKLFGFIFPLEKALLDRELIRVAARHAAIELALGGVTTVVDMYYHEDEVARSVKAVGLRGVLGETVIGFPVVDAAEPYGGLAYAEDFIAAFRDDPLITPAVAPHAPYSVDREHLLAAKALAERHDVPMLMHLAEFDNERALVAERHREMAAGQTVVGYLDSIGFLSDRLTAAHVSYVTEADRAILKARGVGIAHNPKANSKGISGLSPAFEMYRDGLALGLGTDGPMSSNQLDILNVMVFAATVARLQAENPTRFTPYELVDMATMGGARALGMTEEIGSLEPGKKADLVILDAQAPNMQPNYDVYATIAFAAYPGNVRSVIVNGEIVVRERVPVRIDAEAHAAEWRPLVERVAKFAKTLR